MFSWRVCGSRGRVRFWGAQEDELGFEKPSRAVQSVFPPSCWVLTLTRSAIRFLSIEHCCPRGADLHARW